MLHEKEKVLAIVKSIFDRQCSSDFCGCQEGDWGGFYDDGVKDFIARLDFLLDVVTDEEPKKEFKEKSRNELVIEIQRLNDEILKRDAVIKTLKSDIDYLKQGWC